LDAHRDGTGGKEARAPPRRKKLSAPFYKFILLTLKLEDFKF
jgi:hypothetical protein